MTKLRWAILITQGGLVIYNGFLAVVRAEHRWRDVGLTVVWAMILVVNIRTWRKKCQVCGRKVFDSCLKTVPVAIRIQFENEAIETTRDRSLCPDCVIVGTMLDEVRDGKA